MTNIHLTSKTCLVKVKDALVASGEAAIFHMPESEVVSRSGDKCVVALCDQWFLNYGEAEWRKLADKALEQCETYHEESEKNFKSTLDWLKEHACSRTYGLGTRLPWDDYWLVESLSDSTIYMAYYTVCHMLHENAGFDGKSPVSGQSVPADQVDDCFWEAVFYDSRDSLPDSLVSNCKVNKDILLKARESFLYWYGVDLRVSGKDLIRNHLTYYLYNHASIWPNTPSFWPKSIRANGHLLLNGEKMSKSTGNFMTLVDAVEKFSADGTRLTLADAGDSVEDANFVEDTANASVLRLYNFIEFAKNFKAKVPKEFPVIRENRIDVDAMFEAVLNDQMRKSKAQYEATNYKEAIKEGLFDLQNARDMYREICGQNGMNNDLVMKYIRYQTIALSPICPHVCEYLWREVLNENTSVTSTLWPEVAEISQAELSLIDSFKFLQDVGRDIRLKLKSHFSMIEKKKAKGTVMEAPNSLKLYVSNTLPEWQQICVTEIKDLINSSESKAFPDMKAVAQNCSAKKHPNLKKFAKKIMPYNAMLKDRFNESGVKGLETKCDFDQMKVLNDDIGYVCPEGIESLKILSVEEASENIKNEVRPGNPVPEFYTIPSYDVYFRCPQSKQGLLSQNIGIREGDTTSSVVKRLVDSSRVIGSQNVTLYRYENPKLQTRCIPQMFKSKEETVKNEKLIEISESSKWEAGDSVKVDGVEIQGQVVYIVE